MGFVNQGNQYITFDFKHKAKGYDFNRLNRNVLKSGIYKGMSISYAGNDVSISSGSVVFDTVFRPSVTIINDNIQVKIDFESPYIYTGLQPSDTTINPLTGTYYDELLYLTYEYGEVTFNFADFQSMSIRAIETLDSKAIIIGQISFNLAQNITGFSYVNRNYGLFTYETEYAFPDTSYFFNVSHPSLTTTKKWSIDGTNLATGVHKLFIPNTTPVVNGSVQEYDLLLTNVNNTTLVKNNLQVNGNTFLGNSSGDSITLNSSTISTPNGLNINNTALVINQSNNHVGFGVTTPGSGTLDIKTDDSSQIGINLRGASGTNNTTIAFINNTGLTQIGSYQVLGTGTHRFLNSSSTELLAITNTGNTTIAGNLTVATRIGINRTSPQVPLDIQSDSAAFAIDVRGRALDNIGLNRFLNNSGSVRYRMGLWNDDTLVFQDNTESTKLSLNQSGDLSIGRDIYFGSTERKLFLYNFATNNRMYIQADSSGNFELWGGVGVTTSLLLEVSSTGDTNVVSRLTANSFYGRVPLGGVIPVIGTWSGANNTGTFSGASVPSSGSITVDGFQRCDGVLINNSLSPYNGRYTPDITGQRFIRGSTSAGTVAGSNSITITTDNLPPHSHDLANHTHTGTTGTESADHSHSGQTGQNTDSLNHSHPAPMGNAVANDTWFAAAGAGIARYNRTNDLTGEYTLFHVHNFGTGGRSAAHSHSFTSNTPNTNSSGNGPGTSTAIDSTPRYIDAIYLIRVI